MKNKALKIAGFLNLFTAFLHLLGGQITLVHPLIASKLSTQEIAEWIGAWHIVTILLFATAWILLKIAFSEMAERDIGLLQFIGWLYLLCGTPFIASSIWFSTIAPQWVLFFPLGGLILYSWFFDKSRVRVNQK